MCVYDISYKSAGKLCNARGCLGAEEFQHVMTLQVGCYIRRKLQRCTSEAESLSDFSSFVALKVADPVPTSARRRETHRCAYASSGACTDPRTNKHSLTNKQALTNSGD